MQLLGPIGTCFETGMGVVATDLAVAVAQLQDFRSRLSVVVDQFPTSTLSSVFSSPDLEAYQHAWSAVRASVLGTLSPIDQAAISGGVNDAGNPDTTLAAALNGLDTVLGAIPGSGVAGPFPWLLGAGVLLTAVVGVVVIRAVEKRGRR